MKQLRKLGIIGGNGWLGSALGRSILHSGVLPAGDLVVTTSRAGNNYSEWPEVRCVDSAEALLDLAEVVIISVRPEQFDGLMLKLENRLVVSLMAKIPVARLAEATGSERIVRAMPNAASSVRQSYTPWYATPAVTTDDRSLVERLFSSCGTQDEVENEQQLDYMTALTGSGPAFPALLADALISHAMAQGIPEAVACRGVLQTFSGATKLMTEENTPPDEWIKRFLHYGGTTTAGLNSMIHNGFERAVHSGLDAAQQAATGSLASAQGSTKR